METFIKKLLYGYVVLEQVKSPYNGEILVNENIFGQRRLIVGGLVQSGIEVERIWRLVIKQFRHLAIKNCLILGLGAGSAVKQISKFYPKAKILGIEIDREIIKLGEKYFDLREYKNLEIKIADAAICLHDLNHVNKKFDLILVDLYVGDKVPEEVEKDEFLENTKRVLTSCGLAIFNKIHYGEAKEKTIIFGEKLKSIFAKVEAKDIKNNRLFLCQTSGANKDY